MSIKCDYIHHSFRLQFEAILAVCGVTISWLVTFYVGLDIWNGVRQQNPEYAGVFLIWPVSIMLLTMVVALGMTWIARLTWFYIYRYRLLGQKLYVFDPIIRREWSVDLGQVYLVRSFYIPQGSHDRRAKVGHVLQTSNGYNVRLSEALSIWQEIAHYCSEATFDEFQIPWWGVLR